MSVTTYKPAGPEKSNSVIAGNHIGTNAIGDAKVANGRYGLRVDQSRFVTIGGDTNAERNVVSGNNIAGIAAYYASSDLNIEGNFVGLAADGFSAIGNSVGIDFFTSKQSTLKNNVISSNHSYGLWVDTAEDVKITANIIGLSADGLSARPNSSIGLYSTGSKRLQIGTNGDGVNDQLEGNVISANTSVNIRFDSTENSYVAGNIIGLSKQYSLVSNTPATTPGIVISSSTNVRIGTDGSNDAFNESERNVIAGNTGAGIRSIGSTTSIAANRDTANVGIVVAGNWIGVDPSGNRRANQGVGFLVEGNVPGIRLGTNSDGLHDALEANTIAGNTSHGVQIGTTTTYSELSNNAIISGNFIGVLGDGSTLQGNDGSGVVISAAPNTLIGSNGDGVRDSVERNVISGNKLSGIEILGGVNQIHSIARAQSLVDGTIPSNRVSGTIAQADLFDAKGGVSSSWTVNNPIPGGGGDDYAILMTAEIEVLTAGVFTFATYSDDGSRLKVNGVTLATDQTLGGQTLRGSINLPVGTYPIEWLTYERGSNAGFELSVIPGNNVTTPVNSTNNWKVLGDANPHSQIRLKAGTSIHVDAYYSTGRAITNATVRGNTIGTDATGQSSGLGNTQHGISLDGTSTVLIANNLVTGNVGHGVYASSDTKTTLRGNLIGTNATGTSTLGNQQSGMTFVNGSSELVIGGPSPQDGNLLAGNLTGIRLDVPATNISVLRHNRFYHNATVAIDVGPAGSTPNDEGDVDGVRNAPVITAVRLLNDSLLIEGFARPGTEIDFYKSRPYASGFGQGETFLARVVEGGDKDQDNTLGSYNAVSVGGIAVGSDTTNRFRFVLPLSELQTSITGGEWIAAVAIDPTSEFGNQSIVSREISLTATTIAENAGINAVVGTLSTADPGVTTTFTYALVSGSGDTDNAAFNIDGNSLRASSSFDYETMSSYSIRVRSTDQGGLFTEKVFVIQVTNVNEAPNSINLTNSGVAENAGSNAIVGILSATDPDSGEIFVFSIPNQFGDNAFFNNSGTTLRANDSFDFETKNTYLVTVRVTDQGGLYYEKQFSINVTNVSESPSITTNPSNMTVNSGSTASFTAAAIGDPEPTVQWQVYNTSSWVNIPGATSTTYSFQTSASDDGKQFRAVFANGIGSDAITTAATLTVQFAPTVITNPSSTTVLVGTNASFTAAASGNPTPSVKWQVNNGSGWVDIIGATNTTFTMITALTDSGKQYRAVFNNGIGTDATTSAATLTIATSPTITSPSTATFGAGALESFQLTATGSPAPTYSIISGSIPAGLSLNPTTGKLSGRTALNAIGTYAFTIQASNGYGSPSTQNFVLTVANQVLGFDVSKGSIQRSYLRYVDVAMLSSSVASQVAANASTRVKLLKADLNGNNPVPLALTGQVSSNGSTLAIDFGSDGISNSRNSTAGDGYYTLQVDLDADGVFETSFYFYRLFGDTNGDRKVNQIDVNAVTAAMSSYSVLADLNFDGRVNSSDLIFVRRSVGRALKSDLPITK
jgi:parallel beta-helix repeat protein